MTIKLTLTCPIPDSFRVQQVAGMFDVPLADRSTTSFTVEVPDAAEDWQIGLITGPSGSGKSTIARHLFGDSLYDEAAWPEDCAVIDGRVAWLVRLPPVIWRHSSAQRRHA